MRKLVTVTTLSLLAACTGAITGGGADGDDEGDVDDSQATTDETDGADGGSIVMNEAVARAMEWVDIKLPYCQAPNHTRDYDTACSSTCVRPDNEEWDAYRSDCSGLVSWSWQLPAPGRVTGTLAPYNTAVSHVIMAAALEPGDAINNDHHTMLFARWVTPGVIADFIEEPGCRSAEPYARLITAMVTLDEEQITVLHRGSFTAIRHDP